MQRPLESTGVVLQETPEQDLVTLNELDGRDQLNMIALFKEEVAVGVLRLEEL